MAPSLLVHQEADYPEPAKSRSGAKKNLAFALKLAISLALLWYIVRGTPVTANDLTVERYWPLAACIVLLLLQPLVMALRWSMILRALGQDQSFSYLLRSLLVAIFLNQALPSAVGGDAVRAYYGYRAGMGLGALVASIIFDRAFALLGIVVLLAFSLPTLAATFPGDPAVYFLAGLALAAVIGFVTAVLLAQPMLKLAQHRFVPRPFKVLASAWSSIGPRHRVTGTAIALSIVVHVLSCLGILLILASLGAKLPIFLGVALGSVIMLSQNLPISIGGWGVREVMMVTTLQAAGVPEGKALICSLILGVAFLAASLPGAFFWFGLRENASACS
jgi:uncharacterized membrane protein YbhN (UPF0104 family)